MQHTVRLGRYHLTERIGMGGMAEIYRAVTFSGDGNRHDVAVKRLLPRLVEDEALITMLVDEYRLVSHLAHPSIARVYELCEIGNDILIAMEFVDGKDLRSVIEKARVTRTALRFDDIVFLMARALMGLHHAHEAEDAQGNFLNLVHRDFSPANVLIGYNGNVKICDFGIAKAKLSRTQTRIGVIKGKVRYMSPEQAHGKELDRRSDIFAAGSVLYELCTGQPAFKADSEVDLIFKVRDAVITPCRQINPHLPEALANIIERSMARQRGDRYETAAEFADQLTQFLKAYKPKYHPGQLSRFMRELFRKEIDDELRALENYAVDLRSLENADLGRNLLVDNGDEVAAAHQVGAPVNAERAVYREFNPRPTRPHVLPGFSDREETAELDAEATVRIAPRFWVRKN